MNIATTRSSLRKTALIVLGFALSLAPVALLNAASTAIMQPMNDHPALPLSHSITKVAGEKGPFELKLTNTSKASLKVSVKILLSVYSHASDKAKVLPEQTIEAGKDITIHQLAALDKVVVTAEGHKSLELEVN